MSGVYSPTRPVMGRDELAKHRQGGHGRDYHSCSDGYDDMEAAEGRGWKCRASWGRNGWDLGSWPYVAIYTRAVDHGSLRIWQAMQIVEGDHTVYAFSSEADRDAAVDYLFLWYAAGEEWAPIKDRAILDAGAAPVDAQYRGPFSWERFRAEEAVA